MTNIGIIRCEKNMDRCPLTNCIRSLQETQQAFAGYDACRLVGVFTCRCPGGDRIVDLARILKSKGAEAIHFCTCTFASKKPEGWTKGEGFCEDIDPLIERVHREAGLRCVKGTAHLPPGYVPRVWE